MCGILGVMPSFDNKKFCNALSSLEHRGPDGEGVWEEPGEITLGHRRLAILDVTDQGAQPMQYQDRYYLVFNGEIYNFLELKKQLISFGQVFVGNSDTEVLLAAFAQWGEDCVKYFNGMWAFAIWDTKTKKLFLSRDRMGEKPLYFTFNGYRFAFASEQKALLPFLDVVKPSRQFNKLVANSYAYEATEKCVFEGISRFPAAHNGWFDGGKLTSYRYWSTLNSNQITTLSYYDQVDHLRELLLDSCKLRMRADVPLGTGLSGGLDSSAVAACMSVSAKSLDAERLSKNWQNSFVASFPGTVMDESKQATRVAKHLGIQHNKIEVNTNNFVSNIERLVYLLEDIHEVNPIPHINLYKNMRSKGVYVTLDGHGGDELFCGYESSPLHAIPDAIGSLNDIQNILTTYRDMHPKNKFFRGMSTPKIAMYLLKSKLRMIRNEGVKFERYLKNQYGSLNAHLYDLSFRTVLPTLLRNYDRYSMINGVEIRMPLLDYRIVEYSFSIPWTSKLRNGYTKSILRDTVAPWLPNEISYRKDKIGFAPPIYDWIRGPMKEYLLDELSSQSFRESELIDPNSVMLSVKDIIYDKKQMTIYEAEQIWKKFSIYLWEKVFLKDKLWKVA